MLGHVGVQILRGWRLQSLETGQIEPTCPNLPQLGPTWPHAGPSWRHVGPTWRHVGHIFAQNGGGLWRAPVFFVGSVLFFDFCAILAPSWLHFGRVGARFFQFVGRCWSRFWKVLGSSLEVSGDHVSPVCSAFLAKHFVY